jgi:hypothetical protein
MSSILKALERLEEERRDGAPGTPAAEPTRPPPPRPARGRRLGAMALAFGVGLGLAGVLLWVAQVDRVAPQETSRLDASQLARPQGDLVPREPATADPAPLDRPLEVGEVVAPIPAVDAVPPAAASVPEVIGDPRPPPTPPVAVRAPTAPPVPSARQPAEPADVAVVTTDPPLEVARTVWHPAHERRSATIRVDGRDAPVEVHEGDAIDRFVVLEIKPSAVLFDHAGTRVELRIGD